MAKLKNPKHERFAVAYVRYGFNGTRAARAAGASKANAANWASETLKKPELMARIEELNNNLLEETIMSKREALAEMSRLARFDPSQAFDDDGNVLPIEQMPPDVALCIKEIKRDPDTGEIVEFKFQNDKKGATDTMLRHYNAFEDHQKSGAQDIHVHMDEKDSEA